MKNDNYVLVATKLPQWMKEQLEAICAERETTLYDIMQLFLYSFYRHTATPHDVTPDMARLLTLLSMDAGWKRAFNLANPKPLAVAQLIMILEQPGRPGFGAVMIDKPFMGEPRQNDNANDILERVVEVTQQGIYRQVRMLGAQLGCERFADIITTMLDEQTTIRTAVDLNDCLPKSGEQMLNGRKVEYGARQKPIHHHDIDSPVAQRRINFDMEGD